MFGQSNTRRVAVLAMATALLAPVVASLAPAQAASSAFADPAFARVWDRTDRAIEARVAARTWMWGPDGFKTAYEPYAQGPAGQHLVQYFDKSRMEINNPSGDRNSQWFVTNGLLVVDMIAGRVQVGDQQFAPATPANIPVAGDQNGSPDTPTYASLARVASLRGENRAANRTGQPIIEGIGRTGGTGILNNLGGFARYGVYEPTTGHNVADVFWTFMNQKGLVYENGQYVNGTVVDWLYAMGYPITEPYWIKIKADGQEKWVLMQAFQRRILTFSPFNPQGWQVEMGNVGRAYYDWRYNTPAPTPTPIPVALVAVQPTSGRISQDIAVTGSMFPAHVAVTIGLQDLAANPTYTRTLTTVAAKADGTFSAKVNLPADAARFGKLTLTASANGGAVRATTVYQVVDLIPSAGEVVANSNIGVLGVGFPASKSVSVGLLINGNSAPRWVSSTRANADGIFQASVPVRDIAVGSSLQLIAQSETGFRLTSASVRVVIQPVLQLDPTSGTSFRDVTLTGTHFQANRVIRLGLVSPKTGAINWQSRTVRASAQGTFTASVYIGTEYAKVPQAVFVAEDTATGIQARATFAVTKK